MAFLKTNGELFLSFFKVGVSGFGGGQSLVPLIEGEVVNNHQWLNSREFVDVLAVGNAFPGPISTKLAAFVGYQQAGVIGSAFSLLGLVLPTALAMILMAGLMAKFRDSPRLNGLLRGVRPAVIAMLGVMLFRLGWGTSGGGCMTDITSYIVAGVAVALLVLAQVPPFAVMLLAAATGLLLL